MDAKDLLCRDYPNLDKNELPFVISCPHAQTTEVVENFFLRYLYRDVTIQQITHWKRNSSPACVYTVIYKMKHQTPEFSANELLIPFPENAGDLKKMFFHITEIVLGMRVIDKQHSSDRAYISVSYAPSRCECTVPGFNMAAEEPRMRPTITEVSRSFSHMQL